MSYSEAVISEKVERLAKQKAAFILGCDANAHNQVWGSKDDNKRVECFLYLIINNRLSICNKGNTPTFEIKVAKAVIDITICTNNLRQCLELKQGIHLKGPCRCL